MAVTIRPRAGHIAACSSSGSDPADWGTRSHRRAAAALQPCGKASTCVSRDFELHRPTGFLLDHHSASPNILPGDETTDP